jgi:arylsulfatase A-like enzyme
MWRWTLSAASPEIEIKPDEGSVMYRVARTSNGLRGFVLAALVCSTWMTIESRSLQAAEETSATPRPPNVILILCDDLGWGDVGFNGRTEWRTPHIDSLARRGTLFRRWYAGSVVCAPSRSVLLTGRYGIHTTVTRNSDDIPRSEETIAESLKRGGYATSLCGKWHGGAARPGESGPVHPLEQGFDEFTGMLSAVDAWEHFPKTLYFGTEQRAVSGFTATLFTNAGIDFIQRHRDQPFFLYMAYTEPHFHVQAPEEDLARHRGRFEETDPNDPVNAGYAAMIEALDREIGRLMAAVETNGLTRDTLVIFTSDQGATFEGGNKRAAEFHDSNRPFRGQKRTLWEGGIRVPGVVCWPGRVPAERECDDPVHFIDVLPTVCAAAGVAVPDSQKVDGVNLLPLWTGTGPAPDRTLFWEWRSEGANQVAAMRGDYKLISPAAESFAQAVAGTDGFRAAALRSELYNVAKDPAERIMLLRPEETAQLRSALIEWLKTEVPPSSSK